MSANSFNVSTFEVPAEATIAVGPVGSPAELSTSSAAEPSPSPSRPSREVQVRAYLLRAALSADPSLSRISRVLSSQSALDLNLMTAQYGLTFISELIKAINNWRTLVILKRFAVLAKYFDTIIVATEIRPPKIAVRMRKLSSLISDIRIFNRLWGIISMLEWAVSVVKNPPTDHLIRAITYVQVVANNLFQPMENLAYLSSHEIIPLSTSTTNSLWLISTRLWALHIILEFIRLYRERQLSKLEPTSEKASEADLAKQMKADQLWIRKLIVNSAYFPLTIHWSMTTGFLSDLAVGFLGSIAGGARLIPLWKES
ncbi:uncharacterized protein V1516DRAFT_675301 [Lipomyces oligophaga]|uniref:uncharacterized protein n=1 Tax=Lipomyces oligophaga TaxID=45792 RepID=UPI0034CF0808